MKGISMDKKVLVIDDDKAILEVITIILSDIGYEVVTISNGSEVPSAISKHDPSVILLDIWLSGHDGRQIAKQIRSIKKIPIIIMSAHNDAKKMFEEAGADDFIAKPFDISDLADIVEKNLKKN